MRTVRAHEKCIIFSILALIVWEILYLFRISLRIYALQMSHLLMSHASEVKLEQQRERGSCADKYGYKVLGYKFHASKICLFFKHS